SFLFLWVGPQYYAGYLANFLIVMIMTQAAFIYCDSIMLESILRLGPKVIGYATAAGLCIAFACLLTPAFGIVGLCVALLAGRLVQSIALPVIVHSGLGRSAKPSLRSILQPGFAMLLLFAGSAYLGQCLLARNWLEWAACVIGTAGLVLCLALVTGLPDASRKALLQRVWSLRVPKRSWT